MRCEVWAKHSQIKRILKFMDIGGNALPLQDFLRSILTQINQELKAKLASDSFVAASTKSWEESLCRSQRKSIESSTSITFSDGRSRIFSSNLFSISELSWIEVAIMVKHLNHKCIVSHGFAWLAVVVDDYSWRSHFTQNKRKIFSHSDSLYFINLNLHNLRSRQC